MIVWLKFSWKYVYSCYQFVMKIVDLVFVFVAVLTVCYAASGNELTNVSTSVILPDEPKALQGRILFKPLSMLFLKKIS